MSRRVKRPLAQSLDHIAELEPTALVQRVRSLLAEAQALSARLAALNEVGVALQTHLNPEAILQVIAREARWLLDFQSCSVALCNDTGYQEQVLLGDASLAQRREQPIHAGAIGRALQYQHAILLHDLTDADATPTGMHSALILPLRSGGDNIGTLNFYAANSHHYTQSDLRVASAFAVQVAVALQNGRLLAETQQARDELRTVLESIGDAVLVIDSHGRLRLINDAAQRMLNLTHDDVVGRRALWLWRATDSEGQTLLPEATIHRLVEVWSAQPCVGATGICQLSDRRHMEWAFAPLLVGGMADGAVLTFRDISARIQLEKLRDDMLHMLVHDLRTPLSGLIMGLNMLAEPEERVPSVMRGQLFEQTQRAADNLLDQLNTILDVRRLEDGQMDLMIQPASVVVLVEHALEPIRTLIQYNQQTLIQHLAGELPLLMVDERLVQRVIENLVGNAIKFAALQGQIEIGASADASSMRIWVSDNGPGVPADLQNYIFEKYAQAPGQSRRGTGLGLAFCKLVVAAHRGQIGMHDRPGGGSVFWFQLPIKAEARA